MQGQDDLDKTNTRVVTAKEMQLIGEITWLLLHSPLHKAYPLSTLEERFIHACLLGQCQVFYDQSGPIGLVTWAKVSSKWHERMLDSDTWPPVHEWDKGDYLWFMDFVAPFGHCTRIRRELSKQFGNTDKAWCRRIKTNSERSHICQHHRGHLFSH
ncbi:toxin-activating lysine-acyltransferase [Photobacterium makurazakiensis]|uniref:toxin-activating lysine-acyltransferase n=1 Tax=Photobacterium makurazakiensis TaxID=2910234 RepID=UPI003D11048B